MKPYKNTTKERRMQRIRIAVRGQDKPRLSVFRSGRYVYAQVIDDKSHQTIVSASSMEKNSGLVNTSHCKAAEWVGEQVAERALSAGVTAVVFDRGAYRFHGRVKALADGARAKGLLF